jgi:hypothetical protein
MADQNKRDEKIIKEIISLERRYFFEKKNVKTQRQRELRDIIEKHTTSQEAQDDS